MAVLNHVQNHQTSREHSLIQIPSSLEDAVLDLKGLGELVTASEWKRAAIVWAFTEAGKPGPGNRATSGPISINDFCRHEISGLKSKETVRKYRKAWKLAIDKGFATDAKPGDEVKMPDVEWQLYFNPKVPLAKSKSPANRKSKRLEPWDDESWDIDRINKSARLQKMADILDGISLDVSKTGIEGEMFNRVANSVYDLVEDDNKVRGLARLLHSLIEFGASYKHSSKSAGLTACRCSRNQPNHQGRQKT
jgi:hypothetical protein